MSDWFEHFGFGQVGDELFIGAYPQDADDVAELTRLGVSRVFNLVQDVEYHAGGRDACTAALAAAGIVEERVEVVDFGNLLPGHIEHAARSVQAWLREGERVYLHCRAGMQRSATVAAAIVALEENVEPVEALQRVRERNPRANPLEHQRQDLLRWWTARAD
ncbi:MAG: dual specificity protein phosphatase [Solirubrobacteraceae bacterium]|nr:dual specificity protein phosphatase [Solirubrobacteraceae bacterium]